MTTARIEAEVLRVPRGASEESERSLFIQILGARAFPVILLWIYPLRKKFRWLAFTGSMPRWISGHVTSGLVIPFLVGIHSAWHFSGLANQPGTIVHMSYRGRELAKVKDRNRTKLDAAVAGGRVRLMLGSHVREIREDAVSIEVNGRMEELGNDNVIIRIGGDPPLKFLERIGVRVVQKDVPLAGV